MNEALNVAVERYRDEMTQHLQALLRIPSVSGPAEEGMPFGKAVGDALDETLKLCLNLGFDRVVNLDGYCGYAEIGQGEEMVAVLVHLDVVPEGSGWTYPAFGGTLVDGRIYGRGAVDNKGPLISAVYAVRAMMDEKTALRRRVRLIFGCNEETGMACMRRYLKTEEQPVCAFSPDGEYPLINIEKSAMGMNLKKSYQPAKSGIRVKSAHGGERTNMVPDALDAVLQAEDLGLLQQQLQEAAQAVGAEFSMQIVGDELHVHSTGLGAHASRPHLGKNAIGAFAEALCQLEESEDGLFTALRQIGQRIGQSVNGDRIGLNESDPISGDLTMNLGVITADEHELLAKIDMRVPLTLTQEQVEEKYRAGFAGTGIECVSRRFSPGTHVPEDHPLVQTLLRVYHEMTGKEAYCLAIGGGTYSRMFTNRAVAFGPGMPGLPDRCHIADEYCTQDELVQNAQIYAQALCELAGE